ncbi:MAG TPA: PilN domain-containing protein [Candidatus Solibacter sp.]|nr:PilN domain-containing protein [Candidatus Solibacter sp.]
MIRINLLGQPRPKKTRAGGAPADASLTIVGLLLAVVLGFGALFLHYRQMHGELVKLKAQIQTQTAERTRLQGVKAEVERRQQEKAALKQRVDVIEQLQRNRSGGQELLDAVANTVNRVDALWMNGLKRSGNSLQMDGEADSLNAVASFITELKRSGYFDKVEISETKQDERHPSASSFIFKLTCDFTLPSSGTGAQQPPAPAKSTKN